MDQAIGIAKTIRTEFFDNTRELNQWMEDNPDTEISDIKVTTTEKFLCLLVIYRKE